MEKRIVSKESVRWHKRPNADIVPSHVMGARGVVWSALYTIGSVDDVECDASFSCLGFRFFLYDGINARHMAAIRVREQAMDKLFNECKVIVFSDGSVFVCDEGFCLPYAEVGFSSQHDVDLWPVSFVNDAMRHARDGYTKVPHGSCVLFATSMLSNLVTSSRPFWFLSYDKRLNGFGYFDFVGPLSKTVYDVTGHALATASGPNIDSVLVLNAAKQGYAMLLSLSTGTKLRDVKGYVYELSAGHCGVLLMDEYERLVFCDANGAAVISEDDVRMMVSSGESRVGVMVVGVRRDWSMVDAQYVVEAARESRGLVFVSADDGRIDEHVDRSTLIPIDGMEPLSVSLSDPMFDTSVGRYAQRGLFQMEQLSSSNPGFLMDEKDGDLSIEAVTQKDSLEIEATYEALRELDDLVSTGQRSSDQDWLESGMYY